MTRAQEKGTQILPRCVERIVDFLALHWCSTPMQMLPHTRQPRQV
jgi:hypothetical protein